jgi:hypothetical protein
MSLDGTACASIADTLLDFAGVALAQMPEPAALDALRRVLELAVRVWNAHALASDVWGQPGHLVELQRLVELSASPALLSAFEALQAAKASKFAADARVICEWQVVTDEEGKMRFDCAARLPPGA